jgi:hypothetical protein
VFGGAMQSWLKSVVQERNSMQFKAKKHPFESLQYYENIMHANKEKNEETGTLLGISIV